MSAFHEALDRLSIEQTPGGKMPAGLMDELQSVREMAREMIDGSLRHRAFEIEANAKADPRYFPEELVLRFTQKKLYSKWLPGLVGGGGAHPLGFYPFNLEMGGLCLGIANILGPHYVAMGLLGATQSFGVMARITSDIRQAEKSGGHCSVSLAITEPHAGSDMEDEELIARAKVCTLAVRVPGGYEITGHKIFISNALYASWFVGSAFTDRRNPAQSLVIFAVRANAPGIEVGTPEKKMGQAASPASAVHFERVFVPDEDICFSRAQFEGDDDFTRASACLLNDLLSLSRAGVGVLATGIQRRALEMVMEHVDLGPEWAQVQLAKIASNLALSKNISWTGHIECLAHGPYADLHKASVYSFLKRVPLAWQKNLLGPALSTPGMRRQLRFKRLKSSRVPWEKNVAGYGALVKVTCSDLAMESLRLAMDLIGLVHPETHAGLEKMYRDAKLLQIYEGTNELNRLAIAKSFLGDSEAASQAFQEGGA